MMHLQHGDESAVLLLHEEAAYADLGTTRSEPVKETIKPRASVVFLIPEHRATSHLSVAYMATAPPRRAA